MPETRACKDTPGDLKGGVCRLALGFLDGDQIWIFVGSQIVQFLNNPEPPLYSGPGDDFELVAWGDLCTQVPLLLVADAWKPCSVAVWL